MTGCSVGGFGFRDLILQNIIDNVKDLTLTRRVMYLLLTVLTSLYGAHFSCDVKDDSQIWTVPAEMYAPVTWAEMRDNFS